MDKTETNAFVYLSFPTYPYTFCPSADSENTITSRSALPLPASHLTAPFRLVDFYPELQPGFGHDQLMKSGEPDSYTYLTDQQNDNAKEHQHRQQQQYGRNRENNNPHVAGGDADVTIPSHVSTSYKSNYATPSPIVTPHPGAIPTPTSFVATTTTTSSFPTSYKFNNLKKLLTKPKKIMKVRSSF